MSKAFAARLLKTDGCRSRPFHSPFAASVLKKFGWTEGEGLGKTKKGMAEPIQIRRREEALGLGHEKTKPDAAAEWGAWWSEAFNEAASKIKPSSKHQLLSASDSSSEDETPRAPGPLSLRRRYAPRGRPCKPANPQREAKAAQADKAEAERETDEEETETAAAARRATATATAATAAAGGWRKTGRRKAKAGEAKEADAGDHFAVGDLEEKSEKQKKKKRKKKRQLSDDGAGDTCSDTDQHLAAAAGAAAAAAEEADAEGPRSKRNRKLAADNEQQQQQDEPEPEQQDAQFQKPRKRKKKHKESS